MSLKRIAILGSTGSIGINTLNVIEKHPKTFKVVALAARRKAELLYQQAKAYKPELVCLFEKERALWLEKKLKPYKIKSGGGRSGLD